ncbi:MAG: hypothetical protein ACRC2T_01500, partial [Thermoguttaceae bacterium]
RKYFVLRIDGDHRFLDFEIDGKRYFFTKVSHGTKDIGIQLLTQMARQCHLSKAEFLKLVDCPMPKEEYEAKLRDNRIIG